MKLEEQRIAIAEWCGLDVKVPDCVAKDGWLYKVMELQGVPDYLNDLNAMWKAERKIACENWWGYVIALNHKVCEDSDEPHNNDPETSFLMINATAAQRSEALLRTIGKWTDSHERLM